jgi:hypothetical protein
MNIVVNLCYYTFYIVNSYYFNLNIPVISFLYNKKGDYH